MPEEEKVLILTAGACAPCRDVHEAIEQGNYQVLGVEGTPEIEFVDVVTDEGYPYIEKLAPDAIPAAFYKQKQCDLLVNDQGKITIACAGEEDSKGLAP